MSIQTLEGSDTEEHRITTLNEYSLLLLKQLIATPSLSGNETKAADLLQHFMEGRDIVTLRHRNNIWAYNHYYNSDKPTILLNSHLDTVKPNAGYSRDPYYPEIINGKLYGLGSNDAGGCLVSLLATFLYFYEYPDLPYNLCFAATAEEESLGQNGLKSILSKMGRVDFAIVGEPTQMQMATNEMGCMVLDCSTCGVAGHAARNEGENALYKALGDIQWFSTFRFPKESGFMGPIKMTVTEMKAGIQHNIIPDTCRFTVDVRLSDCYPVEEVLNIIKNHTQCEITPRPGIVRPSCIDQIHPIVRAGMAIGLKTSKSPACSDQAWLDLHSLKIGPGDPARSHTANEYIFVDEITESITTYIHLLKSMLPNLINNLKF